MCEMINVLYARILATIKKHRMLEDGENVLVGVSGGPDSMALLHVLFDLRTEYSISLTVAHYNHQLRTGAAEQEALFVEREAKRLGLPVLMGSDDGVLSAHRGNVEESARDRRYEFFFKAARDAGARKIALGHNANDQVETVLMWLFRGSGRRGMGGIPPVRGPIIRPLIDIERKDIITFLHERRISWREDATNQEGRYRRNRIRQALRPLLESSFERGLIRNVCTAAEIVRDEELWVESVCLERFDAVAEVLNGGIVQFAVNDLNKLPEGLQRRLVRVAIERVRGTLRKITFAHVEAILALLNSANPHALVSLPDGWGARREYDALQIGVFQDRDVDFRYEFSKIPPEVGLSEIGKKLTFEVIQWNDRSQFSGSPRTAFLDFDRVRLPLIIRNWQKGDRFHPLGAKGSKKLTDFFIDMKVPRGERRRVPLVVFGDIIAWIGGYRIDHRLKITENSEQVIKMVLK